MSDVRSELHVVVGLPREGVDPDWCDVCLTAAVYAWPLTWITEDGVSESGYVKSCHRCYMDAEDSGGR